jgi:hypothetical protein
MNVSRPQVVFIESQTLSLTESKLPLLVPVLNLIPVRLTAKTLPANIVRKKGPLGSKACRTPKMNTVSKIKAILAINGIIAGGAQLVRSPALHTGNNKHPSAQQPEQQLLQSTDIFSPQKERIYRI